MKTERGEKVFKTSTSDDGMKETNFQLILVIIIGIMMVIITIITN